eukprot:333935-Alexandrium_andersonii.AAC.1
MSASGNSVASCSATSSLVPSSLGLEPLCAVRRLSPSFQPGRTAGGSCGAGCAILSSLGPLANMSDGGPTHCWSSSMSVRLSQGSRRTDRARTAPRE